jgi:putative phosphoribosyl transferase
LKTTKELRIVPGATHLFEEPGALEEVAGMARDWFQTHLLRKTQAGESSGPVSERRAA